jgi:hypothetical protein
MINAPKVRFHKDGVFEINEYFAGLVPMANVNEQAALMSDIKDNGQREPITLYKGKVVDGRCRMKALNLLGMNYIYKELDDDLTDDEVKAYVKSVNTRRNLSITQKVISAAKSYMSESNKMSIPKIAQAWGISTPLLNNGLFILKNRPDLIEPLFNGMSVEIIDKHDKIVNSNKITAIWAYVKRALECAKETSSDHAWTADSAIKTQKGKEWFYDFIKNHGITNVSVMMALADTANYRYSK